MLLDMKEQVFKSSAIHTSLIWANTIGVKRATEQYGDGGLLNDERADSVKYNAIHHRRHHNKHVRPFTGVSYQGAD